MTKKLPTRLLLIIASFLVLLGILVSIRRFSRIGLHHPVFATGWMLFALLVFLGMYNSRKKLAMMPVGKASTWLQMHVVGGFIAMGVFWMHTRSFLPRGGYLLALALLFYLVSISGIIGFILQTIYPRTLTGATRPVLYERIPAVLADLRDQASVLVQECTKETKSETLYRYYAENMQWFLAQPRFFFYTVFGSEKAPAWCNQKRTNVERYMNTLEKKYLTDLDEIVKYKLEIDTQYAAQTVMKGWLLIHVPLAAALLLLAVWHIIVVFVYTS